LQGEITSANALEFLKHTQDAFIQIKDCQWLAWGVLLLPSLQKVVEHEEAECKWKAHLEEECEKVELALKVAEERRIAGEEAVITLLEGSEGLSAEDFATKLCDIECECGFALVEEEKNDRMEVSQGEDVIGTGEVKESQIKGEKSWPKPRPLTKVRVITIDSIGLEEDEDNDSMDSKIAEVHPCLSKAGSKLSGGLKDK